MVIIMIRVERDEVEVPKDVKVEIKKDLLSYKISVEGKLGKIEREFKSYGINIYKEDDKIIVEAYWPNHRQKAMVYTIASHIRNMIKGVTEGFRYRLKIVYSHFPMTVKVVGDEVIVENFLGEKAPRKTKIYGNCKVEVKGDIIEVFGINIEEAGITAGRLEALTRVKNKDRRKFQDGIYIIEKPE